MASPARVAFIAISMVLLCSVAMATDHAVGDDKGWTVDFDYKKWAQDKVFHVGDNLVFNYDNSKHNVFKVNMTQYQNCTFPPANEALTSGKDVIPLKAEGNKWYVCGKADHCAAHQMKLAINVVAPAPAPAPSSPAPAPAPSSPAPAPAPSSSPHSVLSSFSVLLLMVPAIAAIYA